MSLAFWMMQYYFSFLFLKGEGGAPGLPGIAGPRGGPVSVKDIFKWSLTPHRR